MLPRSHYLKATKTQNKNNVSHETSIPEKYGYCVRTNGYRIKDALLELCKEKKCKKKCIIYIELLEKESMKVFFNY